MVSLNAPIVALLTPFDANGAIEWQAFKTYLSLLYSCGVRTVITNGTTGEFPSLEIKERQQVIEFVRENFKGVIVNNVSATCINDVRELIAGTKGCGDYLLLLPPYYYSACEDTGLCRFFISALSGTSMPVMLYNFPLYSGNRIGIDLVAMLLDKNFEIKGIKDSSGDLNNALIYKSNFPCLNIFLGNDNQAAEVLHKGLSGSVSGAANPLPELLIALQADIKSYCSNAQSIQRCLDVWNQYREASCYFEIPIVKAAMGARIADFPIHVRPPFTPIPLEEIDQIRRVICNCLRDFKLLMSE